MFNRQPEQQPDYQINKGASSAPTAAAVATSATVTLPATDARECFKRSQYNYQDRAEQRDELPSPFK
jgi:hypothetical protein